MTNKQTNKHKNVQSTGSKKFNVFVIIAMGSVDEKLDV